jgi:hypothetical protein
MSPLLFISNSKADVSFNLRFFERHGRDLADPWSCRQSAIYQKFLVAEMRSIWVVIHEPQLFQDTLGETSLTAANHPLSIHLRYIRSATYHWRDYLKFRSSEIHSLVRWLFMPAMIFMDSNEPRTHNYPSRSRTRNVNPIL